MSVGGATGRGFPARLLLMLLGVGLLSAPAAPELRWLVAPAPVVEVEGLAPAQLHELTGRGFTNEEWANQLAVFVEPGAGETSARPVKLPPMAGVWRVVGDRLRFEPRFPLQPGVRYRAELKLPGAAPVIAFFELPSVADTPRTTVVQIFPSGDVLPENQLKFYVQFSEPMSRGGVYENVRLLDAHGRVIELPFLELEAELWDPAMTRLTLLIDPGRIKRGVKPLEDMGPVFKEGESYSLVIDATCRDAEGRKLRESFTKKFRVGPADRTPPDPARWKISPVAAGTRTPLIVDFGEPLDHALALRLITVSRGGNETSDPVAGGATLEKSEQRWSFVPAQPWTRGAHRLVIGTTIEDLAGNNIGKAFDVDAVGTVERQLRTERVNLDFEAK